MCFWCAGYGSDRVRRRTKNDSNDSSSNGSRHTPSHLGAQQQLSQVAEAAVGWLSNAAAAAQAALPSANGLTSSCLRKWLWVVSARPARVSWVWVAAQHAALRPVSMCSAMANTQELQQAYAAHGPASPRKGLLAPLGPCMQPVQVPQVLWMHAARLTRGMQKTASPLLQR
jgi:hypothetical protein